MDAPTPTARFEYILIEYGERVIHTTAPLHPGDSVTLSPRAGGMLEERIVSRIEFAERSSDAGGDLFSAFVRFDEQAERVGGV